MVGRTWKCAFLLYLSLLLASSAETIYSHQFIKLDEENPFTSSFGSYDYFLIHNYIHDGNIQILVKE